MLDIETDLKNYYKAMRDVHSNTCSAIEQKYDLYGYSPEMVTSALSKAIAERKIEPPNVQIEGQPASGLSRSNAGLGSAGGK